MKLLIEHAIDVNTPGHRARLTPYQEALRAHHPHVAAYLLEHGAKKIERDAVEQFALALHRRSARRGSSTARP